MTTAVEREEFLRCVREFSTGELDVTLLVDRADETLRELKLYPVAPVIDLGQAAGQLLEKNPEAAVAAALQLISSDCAATRAVTCAMISRLARYNPSLWAGMVRHIAADDDWQVREYAAHVYDSREGFAGVIELHQDFVLEELAGWVTHENYLVRHSATQALLDYVPVNDQIIPRLLELLNPLLTDPSDYVRTGLVIALRAMGRKKPDVIFKYIELHTPPKTEDIREIFTQVLDHRFADKQPERKCELLARLNT